MKKALCEEGSFVKKAQAPMEAVVRAAWALRRWRRPRCAQRGRPGTGGAGSGAKKALCQEGSFVKQALVWRRPFVKKALL